MVVYELTKSTDLLMIVLKNKFLYSLRAALCFRCFSVGTYIEMKIQTSELNQLKNLHKRKYIIV